MKKLVRGKNRSDRTSFGQPKLVRVKLELPNQISGLVAMNFGVLLI